MPDPIPPIRPSLPQQIGRYRIIGRVGRGAMGVVYSAVDEMIDRPVALKVLMADLESDPETRARFYREAQATARLLHPNIVTVYDAGEDQGRSYIAMQLLEGAPLPTYLKRPEAAALDRKLDLMIQMCEGLSAAHAEGIIHRDLKPSNLFVQSDGLLKILDFGVARVTDSSMTAAGTMLGTPDYMSPEQARGAAIDARSDIFSAGAVFYFMLAGRKPFPGPDLPAILRQLQLDEPTPLRGIPLELATLVAQAMAKTPDHRPARVEQLLGELVRFRRQYQADTRRLAVTLRTEFEELQSLAASVKETGDALGIEAAEDDLIADVRQYAFLGAPRGSREAVPTDRAIINAGAQAVRASQERLGRMLEAQYAALRRLEQGEQLLSAGDAVGALAIFEALAAEAPAAARVRTRADDARPRAKEQQARAERLNALIAGARDALAHGDLQAARAQCTQALELEPQANDVTSLAHDIDQAVSREQRRVALLLQRVLERAGDALDRQAFDEAEAAINEAESIQTGAPAIAALRARLDQERAAAEAAEVLRELSEDEIRRARSAFRRGRYDEALQQLEAFVALEPAAQSVIQELDYLQTLRSSIVHDGEIAAAKARELVAKAAAARDRGALEDAEKMLREGLHADPTSAEASELLDEVLVRQLDARVAEARIRTREQRLSAGAPLLAAARLARERGYVDLALKSALAAQRVAPDTPGLASLIEDARRELAAEDRELAALEHPPLLDVNGADEPSADNGMFGWAAGLLRGSLRRRKA